MSGDREVLAAIVFVATFGCTWQQLPAASFGPSGATPHRRCAEWTKARVWAKPHRLVLDELGSRGDLDRSRCSMGAAHYGRLHAARPARRRPITDQGARRLSCRRALSLCFIFCPRRKPEPVGSRWRQTG
ncbi:transposase [Streptomyces sp. NBC_01236]|uniref:transposase n=1 Tax=Streptomyces sp. NBC_01236 TaxID=2903789 RepID=UPI003FA3A21A